MTTHQLGYGGEELPASASQAAVTVSATSTTTQLRVDLNKVNVLCTALRAALVSRGVIKGSA